MKEGKLVLICEYGVDLRNDPEEIVTITSGLLVTLP